MDKQIRLWIGVIDKARENIIGTFNYNGLIIDDLEALIQDMKRAQGEAERHIRICDRCATNKFVTDNVCKQCARILHPEDIEI